jgi:hypothetical protein
VDNLIAQEANVPSTSNCGRRQRETEPGRAINQKIINIFHLWVFLRIGLKS